MSDWLSNTLNLASGRYCENCGEGDSDWCIECDGCRYASCDTCTCERVFTVEATYIVQVRARKESDIDKYLVDSVVGGYYPEEFEVTDSRRV